MGKKKFLIVHCSENSLNAIRTFPHISFAIVLPITSEGVLLDTPSICATFCGSCLRILSGQWRSGLSLSLSLFFPQSPTAKGSLMCATTTHRHSVPPYLQIRRISLLEYLWEKQIPVISARIQTCSLQHLRQMPNPEATKPGLVSLPPPPHTDAHTKQVTDIWDSKRSDQHPSCDD